MEKHTLINLLNTYFPIAIGDVDNIHNLVQGEDSVLLTVVAKEYYLISHYIVTHYDEQKYDILRFMNFAIKNTTCYISPYAVLDNFTLNGVGVYIDACVKAGDGLVIGNNVTIGKCHYNEFNDNNHIEIGKNCTLGNNIKIYCNLQIGNNVKICDNAIIKENIVSDVNVDIVNQLQLKDNRLVSTISSQHLIVYGIVPKFRNTITILGEGFYNPKVVIKLRSGKVVDFDLTYWDKNKIILKFKNNTQIDGGQSLLIVFSNGNKITLINNFGLEKALKTLN